MSRGISLEAFSKKIQRLSIPLAQYRNKVDGDAVQIEDLKLIREHYQGKLIVNDALNLIEYADGLHLGQEDIRLYGDDLTVAIERVRQKVGNKILGLSTHNRAEILEANGLALDYIGLGAYRGTQTKEGVTVLGEKAIALAQYSQHPVGLIGGVKMEDVFPKEITYKVIGSDLYEN